MSSGLSSEFKELVRSQTNIVDLVGESVALISAGSEFKCICPFHDDHNPSMVVYPDRQSFRCWTCNTGGDCFSWIQLSDGLEFFDALKYLAERANLELPKSSGFSSQQNTNNKASLHEVLDWATEQYSLFLKTDPRAERARSYLAGRGFTAEIQEKFRLGAVPKEWSWLLDRARGKFSPQQLLDARLISERKTGNGYFDFFRDRVLFPVSDERSRVVAFGGRILPGPDADDGPKYLNSLESPVFSKSNLLYGLDAARQAIRAAKTVVVCEGYTDCITAHQYGIENVVATLGTALTESHVTLLKRFAERVVLVYDGDAAGQSAAEKSIVKFLSQEVDLRVLTIPGNLDPAEFLEKHGADALRDSIENALEAWEHKLQSVLRRVDLNNINGRHQILNEMLEMVVHIPKFSSTVREEIILGRLAERLRLPERTIRKQLAELRRENTQRASVNQIRVDQNDNYVTSPSVFSGKLTKDEQIECDLIGIIFSSPATMKRIAIETTVDDFRNPQLRSLYQVCLELNSNGELPSYEKVTSALEELDLKSAAAFVDGQAREKDVFSKLSESAETAAEENQEKDFLDQAIGQLIWRRDVESHERSKNRLTEIAGRVNELDGEVEDLLKAATQFHKKRATKNSTT